MDQNSWESHQMHVLSQLDSLRKSAEKANENHAKVREDLASLKADICSFKTSQKWELRIFSAIWGLIVLIINAIIGRHG